MQQLQGRQNPIDDDGYRHYLMQIAIFLLAGSLFLSSGTGVPQSVPSQQERPGDNSLFDRVVENQKKNDAAMDLYERIERVETRKTTGEAQTTEIKTSRVVPAGTGAAHIPVGPDGRATDPVAYRTELEKLEKSLVWAADSGRAQHEAYEKIAKKRKDREDLIAAARNAFIFTFIANEQRDSHTLLKYSMNPNPAFRPTSRATSIYAHVRGTVWVDGSSGELARIEGEVTDDIALGLFLAKVYKGSHFMQERYEMVPGLWLPTFSQYDFDGRKFLSSFSLHERTFYSNYRLVGSPKDALALVRAELKHGQGSSLASP